MSLFHFSIQHVWGMTSQVNIMCNVLYFPLTLTRCGLPCCLSTGGRLSWDTQRLSCVWEALGISSSTQLIWCTVQITMSEVRLQWVHNNSLAIICLIIIFVCLSNDMNIFPSVIKTGESGLTTFRLLQKTGCWVWVQANARLVYKGGRPDFIIARQRALLWVINIWKYNLSASSLTVISLCLKIYDCIIHSFIHSFNTSPSTLLLFPRSRKNCTLL